ncbi:ABC-2 family transporter protein [Candidatus Methanoplasma termitum]|uniref:ABC-2 family transporter protein n=1 Tax=Candidatus Methanoplasma termitum TaxID=1577791 RepID=A0A0A7LCH6_9ARCH|nr:ABC transporter permease [Candidatus Methanoplasma termitum]AIZ56688.1 ABC-2 family transporter protein [Candidatus Methanoplasma termitum]MCL2333332.1 ABC transporter permease [Candidatus Methanoplasma sp.]
MDSSIKNHTIEIGIRNDLRQICVVTRYEILRHLRSKKMYAFAGIAVLLLVLITGLGMALDGGLSKDPQEFMSGYVSLISLFVIVGVSLFCASTLSSEFEERTALLIFPRPMKRVSLFIGKAMACYIVCGGVIILYYFVSMIISLLNTGSVYPAAFASLGLALLFMLGTGGFALLMSSLFNKGAIAVIITIAALLLIFNIIDGMSSMFNFEPVFSITYAGADISNVINGNVTNSVYMDALGGYITYFYPSHGLAIAIMVVWATVTTSLSALLFIRREF